VKTATIAAAFLALALSPASGQSPGDQLTCIGKLFNRDIYPPNRMVLGDRPLIHESQITDQEGGYWRTIDRDGSPFPADQWPCGAGDTCRVVGTLAWEIRHLLLIVRDGKPIKVRWHVILDVRSVEKVEARPRAND